MNKEFIEAVEQLEKERKISKALLLEAIETALKSAFKKDFGERADIIVRMDEDTGDVTVSVVKVVVDEVASVVVCPCLVVALVVVVLVVVVLVAAASVVAREDFNRSTKSII